LYPGLSVLCCEFIAIAGVRIINCARGGIVDETALLQMLQSGQVGGAALDVFTTEPPGDALRALIAHPNLVCTPHLGASTEEAQINVARDIATQMCDVFDQRDFVGVVNVPYLAASTQVHMKPFMQLAESLGIMQAQLSPSPVTKVDEPYCARTARTRVRWACSSTFKCELLRYF
jgi:D-3-phosphoglycerate dehydrogenase